MQRAMLIHSQNVTSLAQASLLAKDIQNSLKFPSEGKFIAKAGEQSRCQPEDIVTNTNTTKDPKDKSVIGESSKQGAKGMQCYNCHGHSYFVAQ